jgi:aminomethyltransferase
MGEITVTGPNAFDYLQFVTSNDVSKLSPGKAQYSLLLNEGGGVVDDIIVYMRGENDYFICVNAANTDKDYKWLCEQNHKHNADVKNVSADYGQIAIQGPKAVEILAAVAGCDAAKYSVENFANFTFRDETFEIDGESFEVITARTGYTGEDGFEVFCPAAKAAVLWDALIAAGEPKGLKPCGLGARDSLRLEVCYPLHGHELGDEISALSSGVGWVVKLKKGEFIGREALQAEKDAGLKRKLVGLEVLDRGIVREECKLYNDAGDEVGWTTSGTKPPSINKAVALGFVPTEMAANDTELFAEVRGRKLKVKVIPKPFYKKSS